MVPIKQLDILLRHYDEWYNWGEADCSQQVVNVWKEWGYAPYAGFVDASSDTMYDNFRYGRWKATKLTTPQPFALVFYGAKGQTNNASHVGFCLWDNVMLGANGGNRDTNTVAQAQSRDARFKVVDINYKPTTYDILGIYLPDYAFLRTT